MGLARLDVDRPLVALQRHPSLPVVLGSSELEPLDGLLCVRLLLLPLDHDERLADVDLPDDLAAGDVEDVRHRNRGPANVHLGARGRKRGAGQVTQRQPPSGGILAGSHLQVDLRGRHLLPRALEQLQDLVALERPHHLGLLVKLGEQTGLAGNPQEGLLPLLQEWRALGTLEGNPPRRTVTESPAPYPHGLGPCLLLGALEDLEELSLLELPEGLCGGDIEAVSDGHILLALCELLQDFGKAWSAQPMPPKLLVDERNLLLAKAVAGQAVHKLVERGLADLALASGKLLKQLVHALLGCPGLGAEQVAGLLRRSLDDLHVSSADSLSRRPQPPLGRSGSRGELRELHAGLEEEVAHRPLVSLVLLQRPSHRRLCLRQGLESIVGRALDALQLRDRWLLRVRELRAFHGLLGLLLRGLHRGGPLLHGLRSEGLALGLVHLLQLLLALLQHRRLRRGGLLLQRVDLRLLRTELGAELDQRGLHLHERALLDAGNLHRLLVDAGGCLRAPCKYRADVRLDALHLPGIGRRGLEVQRALLLREGHPHRGAVPGEDALGALVPGLVVLVLQHLDALPDLDQAHLLPAVEGIRRDRGLLADKVLAQEWLEIGQGELPVRAGDALVDRRLLLLSEAGVVLSRGLAERVQEGRQLLQGRGLALCHLGPDALCLEAVLLGVRVQSHDHGLHQRVLDEFGPVVGEQRHRDLRCILDVALQLLEAGLGVLDQLLRDKALLSLGELLGELCELDLALRQPRLQLGQVRRHRPAHGFGKRLGILEPEREELPCVNDGSLCLALDLSDLLADAPRLLRRDVGHLGVVKLVHRVGELLHGGLHAGNLLAGGLHLGLALALCGVLLELRKLRGGCVQLLLEGEELLGAHLGGGVGELLGVHELLHDKRPRVRDRLLRGARGGLARNNGLARLGGGEGLDAFQEGQLALGGLLDLGLRLLDLLHCLGDELGGLQPLLLLRGGLHDGAELPLRRGDARAHARELLLEEALRTLQLHVDELGRGAELGVGGGCRFVHALDGLSRGLVLSKRHRHAGHLLDLGLRRLKPDRDFAEHLLHADALLRVLGRSPQLGDFLLHVVHPRLELPQLGAGAGTCDGKLLQLGSLLEKVLPRHDDACLSGPFHEVCVLHRLCQALRDGLARGTDVAQGLRGLAQPLDLRLCGRHLGLDLL
mmetsp:Transcript_93531/g.292537  ORF Transcript_93531/g.292537 Transcript_93531/m.292537 type:complete len:1173 (-) Transcript_93531:2051-5569(-)